MYIVGNSGLVHKLKSAPLNSMTSRLARALAIVNTECGESATLRLFRKHESALNAYMFLVFMYVCMHDYVAVVVIVVVCRSEGDV